MRCPRCENDNLEPAQTCQVCGAALGAAAGTAVPAAGNATDQPLVGLLYRAMVGPVNTDKYLERFARYDAAGKASVGWHWPACFATLGWLAFRRMWREALLYAGLSVTAALTLFSLAALVWGATTQELWALAGIFAVLQCVWPALCANALYYRHCNRQVTQALAAASDIRQTYERLATHASTRRRAWFVAQLTLAAWLLALALAAWLINATPGSSALALFGAATPASAPVAAASSPLARASAPVLPASNALAPASAASASSQAASAPAPAASVAQAPASAASAAPQPMAVASAAPAAAPAPAASAVTAPVAPVAASRPAKARKPVPSVKADAAPASSRGRFIIAVGQFAQEQNASRAYDKLEAAGMPVHSNAVPTEKGTLQLIRVGPYKTSREAHQAAQKIEALGLPAVVMKR